MRCGATLAALAAVAVLLVDVVPAPVMMFLLAGPNLATLVNKVPLVMLVSDWFETCYVALPAPLRFIIALTLGTLWRVLAAVATPSALLSWASLASLTGATSAVVHLVRRAIYRLLVPSPGQVLSSSPAYVIALGNIAAAIITLMVLSIAYRTIPTHSRVLVAGLGQDAYIGCALFACALALFWSAFAPGDSDADPGVRAAETASLTGALAAVAVLVSRQVGSGA